MKTLLSKIRELPAYQRKIIFWIIIIILALTLLIFYTRHIQKRIVSVNAEKTREELQLHYLEEILDKVSETEFPKIEMPEINQETIQGLERIMEEAPKEGVCEEPIE
jgi:hypothetical protein